MGSILLKTIKTTKISIFLILITSFIACFGIAVQAQALPDLTVIDVWWIPENPRAGDEITFYSTIQNIGDEATPIMAGTAYLVCDYIDNLSSFATNCFDYGGVDFSLEVNETQTITWPRTLVWPDEFSFGSHTFKVIVDTTDLVNESDEANNSLEKVFTAFGNVYGWAWSERIGWISFNCLNDYNGDGISDDNHCSGVNPDTGLNYVSYGVNVDSATGLFSGHAWSDNIGWIKLDPADSYPEAPNYSAKLDLGAPHEVSGWARALSPIGDPNAGGWDGWIKLRGLTNEAVPQEYGVSLYIIPVPKEFEEWAWSDNVIGWLRFNDKDFDGSAGTVDYQVMTNVVLNNPPTAINLNVTEGDYCCFSSAPPIFLNWTFDDPGDTQSAYQIQVDDSGSGFPSPEIDTCMPIPGTCSLGHCSETYTPPGLIFDTTYWWRLKVWDSSDAPSDGWIYPASSFITDFSWPQPDFDWSPFNPKVGQAIQFCSKNDGVNCLVNLTTCAAGCNSWAWDFGDNAGTSSDQNPIYTYSNPGNYTVELQVTDGIGTCPAESTIAVEIPPLDPPIWKEIPPF